MRMSRRRIGIQYSSVPAVAIQMVKLFVIPTNSHTASIQPSRPFAGVTAQGLFVVLIKN